jgi:hypothetical protein
MYMLMLGRLEPLTHLAWQARRKPIGALKVLPFALAVVLVTGRVEMGD